MHPCLPFHHSSLVRLLMFLMFSLTLLGHSFAQVPSKAANAFKGDDLKYQLSIENHRISLNAEDARLKNILESIGQRMNIDVVARIPEDEKATIQFNDQPLEAALKLLNVNYALITDSEDKDGTIKQIVVVPEGQQAQLAIIASSKAGQQTNSAPMLEKGSRNEPFKFEFDPSKVIESSK